MNTVESYIWYKHCDVPHSGPFVVIECMGLVCWLNTSVQPTSIQDTIAEVIDLLPQQMMFILSHILV